MRAPWRSVRKCSSCSRRSSSRPRSARGAARARRDAARLLVAAGIPLLALIVQRGLATGRYTLLTEHGGLAALGSFVPGAFESGWIDPRPFAAAARPGIASDPDAIFAQAWGLAWNEAARRPAFHLTRIATQTLRLAVKADGANLFWSVRTPEALPPEIRARGEDFSRDATPWLYAELAGIQALFAATLVIAYWRRDRAIGVLAISVALKVLIGAALSPMSRLLIPATALELLAISLAARHLASFLRSRRAWLAVLVTVVPTFLVVAVPRLERRVLKWDAKGVEVSPRNHGALASQHGGLRRAGFWHSSQSCRSGPASTQLFRKASLTTGTGTFSSPGTSLGSIARWHTLLSFPSRYEFATQSAIRIFRIRPFH